MNGRGNVAGTSELLRSAIENVVRQAVLADGGWVMAFNADGGGLEVQIGLPVKASGFWQVWIEDCSCSWRTSFSNYYSGLSPF